MSILVELAWLDESSGFRPIILGVWVIKLFVFALFDYVARALALPVLVQVLNWILTLRLNSRADRAVALRNTLLEVRMLTMIALVFGLVLSRAAPLRIRDFRRRKMQVDA